MIDIISFVVFFDINVASDGHVVPLLQNVLLANVRRLIALVAHEKRTDFGPG